MLTDVGEFAWGFFRKIFDFRNGNWKHVLSFIVKSLGKVRSLKDSWNECRWKANKFEAVWDYEALLWRDTRCITFETEEIVTEIFVKYFMRSKVLTLIVLDLLILFFNFRFFRKFSIDKVWDNFLLKVEVSRSFKRPFQTHLWQTYKNIKTRKSQRCSQK